MSENGSKKAFKKRLGRTTSLFIPTLDVERARSTSLEDTKSARAPMVAFETPVSSTADVLNTPPATPRSELKAFDDNRSLLRMVFTVQLDAERTVSGCRISYANKDRTDIYKYGTKGRPDSVVAYVSMRDLNTALKSRDLSTGDVLGDRECDTGRPTILNNILEGIGVVRFDPIMLPDRSGAILSKIGIKTGTMLLPLDEVYRAFLTECSIHPREYLSAVCACLGMHLSADIVGLHVLKTYAHVAEDLCQVGTASRAITANPGCIYPDRRCAYWRTRTDFEEAIERITDRSEKVLRNVNRVAETMRSQCVDVRMLIEQTKDGGTEVEQTKKLSDGATNIDPIFEQYCDKMLERNDKTMKKYYRMQHKLDGLWDKCEKSELRCKDLVHQRDHALHTLEHHVTEHRGCTNAFGTCEMAPSFDARESRRSGYT